MKKGSPKEELYRRGGAYAMIAPKLVYLLPGFLFVFLYFVGSFFGYRLDLRFFDHFLIGVLITGMMILFFPVFFLFTDRPFVIFDTGIQYVTKQLLWYRNYPENFIPYDDIREIILLKYTTADYIQLVNKRGWKYDIPYGCCSQKVGKNTWRLTMPLEEMLNKWSGRRGFEEEEIEAFNHTRIIYTLK